MIMCVIIGWMIVVDFLVVFSSSKDDTPVDTPATRRLFLRVDSLVQLLHISWPPLGRAVRAASASGTKSLSQSVPGKGGTQGKFNFGVSTGGREGEESSRYGEMEAVISLVWRSGGSLASQILL